MAFWHICLALPKIERMNQTSIAVYRHNQHDLTRLDIAPHCLTDVAASYPGIYTIARTYYHNKVLGFDQHLARLEESAHILNIPLQLDRARLRAHLRRCVDECGFTDTRFCISIPGTSPDTYHLALEALREVDETDRQNGVRAYTIRQMRDTPRAKSTAWIEIRRTLRQTLPNDAYEALLLGPNDTLLEGTGSNFYAVLDGELRTAGQGMLSGTARAGLLRVAPALLSVHTEAVRLPDLPRLDEAMLTSSSRGVVPITYINGEPINGGRPGPITQALSARYDAWAEAHLEPL